MLSLELCHMIKVALLPFISADGMMISVQVEYWPRPVGDELSRNALVSFGLLGALEEIHDGFANTARFDCINIIDIELEYNYRLMMINKISLGYIHQSGFGAASLVFANAEDCHREVV